MEIIQWPDPRLHQISEPVTEFDEVLKTLIEDMAQAMLQAGGIGLSAVQVGVHKRVFVMGDRDGYIEYVNPRIVDKTPELVLMPEGCLSFRRVYDRIERAAGVQAEWQNRFGEPRTGAFKGVWARCFQHESDHLEGITFESLMTPTARKVLRKQAARGG